MAYTVINPNLDTVTYWFPVDPSQNDSDNNTYLSMINDMIVGFYQEGAFGHGWATVTLPASPSKGKEVTRKNTDTGETRKYVYDGNIWVVFESLSNLPKTAFGDLRVAELSPIFQGSFEYTVDNTRITTNTVNSSGTVTQASGMAVITSGTTTGGNARLRATTHAKYRAGLGGLLRFTSLFTSPIASTEQFIGLADEIGSLTIFKNGYMIGYNGITFGFHRFQNDVLTTVALSSWDDPLDGTGASGMTIDLTKMNVWEIRFQYLGAGAIELWVESDSTGKFVLVHRINYANQNTSPSVHNPNFHFNIWVENNVSSSVVVKCSSYAFFVEGYTRYRELHQPHFSSEEKSLSSITSEVALFTIRNRSQYASKNNFINAIIANINIAIEASSANNIGAWRLVFNATIGGSPSYSDINTNDSIIEIDTSGTTVTSGVTLIGGNLAGKNDKIIENIADYVIMLGRSDTLTLAISSANSATFNGSLLWKELF